MDGNDMRMKGDGLHLGRVKLIGSSGALLKIKNRLFLHTT